MVIIAVVSTKGGIGKTTLTANLAAVLADMGFRVLMLDTDTQASLSKYYPLHYRAPNGMVSFCWVKTTKPPSAPPSPIQFIPIWTSYCPTTSGTTCRTRCTTAPTALSCCATSWFIPVSPKTTMPSLSTPKARSALSKMRPALPPTCCSPHYARNAECPRVHLRHAGGIGAAVARCGHEPADTAAEGADLCARPHQRRTDDRRKHQSLFPQQPGWQKTADGVGNPPSKAYKEAATLRIPVHCHEWKHAGKSESARQQMINLVCELFPQIGEGGIECHLFGDNLENLLAPEDAAPGEGGGRE